MKKWVSVISGILLGTDLTGKYLIEKQPDDMKEKSVLGGKLLIRKVHNNGFALNLLSGEEKIVKGGSLVAGVLLFIYYLKLLFSKKGQWKFAGVSLMLAGAISNLYDRIRRGYVVDYLAVPAADPQIRKITFNIGDCVLMAGALIVSAATAIREISREIRKKSPLSDCK